MKLKEKIKQKGLNQRFIGKKFGISDTEMSTLVRLEDKYEEIKNYLNEVRV